MVRTLRLSDLKSLPKGWWSWARKGNCLQHLCALQQRKEDDSLTKRGLGDHFIDDCVQLSGSPKASGQAGDWWEKDPGRQLGLFLCEWGTLRVPEGGKLARKGEWHATVEVVGSPFSRITVEPPGIWPCRKSRACQLWARVLSDSTHAFRALPVCQAQGWVLSCALPQSCGFWADQLVPFAQDFPSCKTDIPRPKRPLHPGQTWMVSHPHLFTLMNPV